MQNSYFTQLYKQAKPNLFILTNSDTTKLTSSYSNHKSIKALTTAVTKHLDDGNLSHNNVAIDLIYKVNTLLLTLPWPYFLELKSRLYTIIQTVNKTAKDHAKMVSKNSYKYPFYITLGLYYELNSARHTSIHYLSQISSYELKGVDPSPIINQAEHYLLNDPLIQKISEPNASNHIKHFSLMDYVKYLISLANMLAFHYNKPNSTGLAFSKNQLHLNKASLIGTSMVTAQQIR